MGEVISNSYKLMGGRSTHGLVFGTSTEEECIDAQTLVRGVKTMNLTTHAP